MLRRAHKDIKAIIPIPTMKTTVSNPPNYLVSLLTVIDVKLPSVGIWSLSYVVIEVPFAKVIVLVISTVLSTKISLWQRNIKNKVEAKIM